MPKTEYQGKDFFERSDFRGLLLADYQEALGQPAQDLVEELNGSSLEQFARLDSFQQSIQTKSTLKSFYKSQSPTKRNLMQTCGSGFQEYGMFDSASRSYFPQVEKLSSQASSTKVFNIEPAEIKPVPTTKTQSRTSMASRRVSTEATQVREYI